jgi:HAD superfamily hydrolase (TIGR01549 family)
MLAPNGIKAVFYDLDGTLRVNDPPGREVFAVEAARLGLVISAENHLRAMRWEHSYFAGSDEIVFDQAAYPETDAFWINFSRRQLMVMGASPQQAEELAPQINEYMREQYSPQDVLLPGVQHILKTLKDSGYILALVSNRDELHQDYLQGIGLGEYFDFTLMAGQVNSWKPDVGIFEHALRMANVKAEETIYVGDNYFADVIGARNAGLNPVLLDIYDVFDQPDCPVIHSHAQLLDLLEKEDV